MLKSTTGCEPLLLQLRLQSNLRITIRHPEIHKAMRKLKEAKEDLEKAAHDYGGHKVKAIEAINQALAELHAGLEFDK